MPNISKIEFQFLDTVGVEFESVGLDNTIVSTIVKQVSNKLGGRNLLTITRDASTESFKINYPIGKHRLPLYIHTGAMKKLYREGEFDRLSSGYEIITDPVEIETFEKLVFHTIKSLENFGDFITERAATHFHIGFVNNLRLLKNLLRICLWLDPFLYRLGGMGGKYRGDVNQSAYARPLLYPPCVSITGNSTEPENSISRRDRIRQQFRRIEERDRSERIFPDNTQGIIKGTFARVINTESALNSTCISDFWESFGVFPYELGTPKYHPSRYTGCNFYAVIQHGTIEFRHFNQSFNYNLIISIGKFLRALVELSSVIDKQDIQIFYPRNPLIQLSDNECIETMDLLLRLFHEYEIENIPKDYEQFLIMNTTLMSSFKEITEKNVLTHVRDSNGLPKNLAEKAGLILVKEVHSPNHVDIHTISEYPLIK